MERGRTHEERGKRTVLTNSGDCLPADTAPHTVNRTEWGGAALPRNTVRTYVWLPLKRELLSDTAYWKQLAQGYHRELAPPP